MQRFNNFFIKFAVANNIGNDKKDEFKQLFERLRLDEIKEEMLSEEIFDCAINLGEDTAVSLLQNAYNILIVKGSKLNVTSIMDDETIKSINSYKKPLELFVWLNMNQAFHYKHTEKSDLHKWINNRVIKQLKDYFETH